MATLTDYQVEVDGLLLGPSTAYLIEELTTERPELRTQDTPRPRGDGIAFGRDEVSGAVVSLSLTIVDSAADAAWDALQTLAATWDGTDTRTTAGSLQVLRYKLPGRPARRLYGRTRRFSPVTGGELRSGAIPVVADFQARDHRSYADTESTLTLQQLSSSSSGLVAPLVEPLSASAVGERPGFVTSTGSVPTPLQVTFYGPAASPKLTNVTASQVLALDLTIAAGDFVTIDTLAGTVLRNGTANVAGKLTRDSTRLADFVLPTGTTEFRYQAIDATGTSKVELRWRDAWAGM